MKFDISTTGKGKTADHFSAGILIVERDETSAEMMQRFLKSTGYRNIHTVVGSATVIELLYEEWIDILLVDSDVLTSLDGSNLLDKIRHSQVHQHLPIIVLTSDVSRQLRLQVLAQGANDILVKPADANEMALRLQNALLVKAYRDLVVYHDDLTGLPNRDNYTDRLNWAIKYSQRYGAVGAVLHIDIDRFKKVVEALGWTIGDRLLRSIAKNLAHCVRDTDIVAQQELGDQVVMLSRLSGNEFSVLLCGIDRPDSAATVAQRILEKMQTPVTIGDHELIASCSIGIAAFPADGKSVNEIVSAANNAMQNAKRAGGNSFSFASQKFNERAVRRLNLEADLRHAIGSAELSLVFQPKIDLFSNRIEGAEALLRWRHPARGMVSPTEFIPVAEESGLISLIGNQVIDMACRQIRDWLDSGINAPRISLNISSLHFAERNFVDDLAGLLDRYKLLGQQLCIEITESVIMGDIQTHLKTLEMLRALGVELSVDDFGTGYSSLAYLKRLPLHELKIDRSFLSAIPGDDDSVAIITAIISMGHRLGLKIVAEGIETQQQLDFLRSHGCNTGQGFLFSPGIAPDQFAQLLRTGIELIPQPNT